MHPTTWLGTLSKSDCNYTMELSLILLDDYYADDEDQQDSTTIESKSRIIQEPNSELRQADLVIPGRKVSLHIIKELIEKFSFFS